MIKYTVMISIYNGWANSDAGSHEELIQILVESGANGGEAFCNSFTGNNKLLKLYQNEMRNTDLKMPVMDLIANLAVDDKVSRAEAYDKMKMGIDICDAFNAEIVHVAGCSLNEGITPSDGKKLIAEGLMEFIDDVEKRGMILAIEDFDPSPDLICSAADCIDILDQTDNRVKFVFDTGNFEAVGEHAEDNFDLMFDRTCHFHFKDFKKDYSSRGFGGTYFGQGMVKNHEVAQAINKNGYSGWVALESYPQNDNGPQEIIEKELAILKSMFQG